MPAPRGFFKQIWHGLKTGHQIVTLTRADGRVIYRGCRCGETFFIDPAEKDFVMKAKDIQYKPLEEDNTCDN